MTEGKAYTALLTSLLLIGAVQYGGCACHLDNYVSSCILNIMDEHIEATAIINHCHLPLDVTFLISYQYKNSTLHKWKYTFVTTNQNERVMIPGLLLPIAPHAPVFLYARVPEAEFNMHNSSFVAIQASFIAELSTDKWEEADFLNHTVFIPSTKDCRYSKSGSDPIPWIIGGLFIVTLLSGSFGAGCYLYRRRKLAVDQMALVSAMEVGLPGSQPYQMDAGTEGNPGDSENTNQGTSTPPDKSTEAVCNNSQDDGHLKNSETVNDEMQRNGTKGFKFGKLKEEVNFGKDSAVIIGNPAYREDQQGNDVRKESQEQPKNCTSEVKDYSLQNGSHNNCYQEEDVPVREPANIYNHTAENFVSDEDVLENREVLDDDQSLEFENGENGGGSNGQVGQGAKRKVRGAAHSLNGPSSSSSTLITSEAANSADSQKSL